MNTQRCPRVSSSLHRGLCVAWLTCILASCALIHENSTPHAQIRPEQINLADDIHLARDGWPSARWWTRYRDPQLDALIERALADAPTMGTARTRVAVAKSDVELVSAGSNLQVVALAVLDQEHVSANGFLSAFALNAPQFGLSGPWYTEGIVGLGASLNVDIWGKQRAHIAASIGVHNARLAEMSAVELEISTDVAQIYYGIQTTYELIELLNESHELAVFAVQAHEARAARGLESRA
jgi:multidrug efflux system outer membrane protein